MADVTRIHPADDHVTAPATITPAEFKSLLAWLGLSKVWFAKRMGFKDERQVAKWEDGHAKIPEKAAAELVRLWNEAAERVTDIVNTAAQQASPTGVIVLHTYRVDKDYPGDYPSAYHRALMCRAMDHLLMRTSYRVQIRYQEATDAAPRP